ncbi:unnamed protein product [Ilex paraguariensis]|uniref:Protein ARV n=1 Tax=Ilex paraguariensis TaxID=185542 RepID=A0ABC8TB73_9AQUA
MRGKANYISVYNCFELDRYRDILLSILVSSYFKIFFIAMMVWEFPSSVVLIIDIFVLSSNTLALKVISESATMRCFGVCFTAHALKFLASRCSTFILPKQVVLRGS